MARVTVVAKRRFYYGGRDVSPGPVEMHAADAAAFARRGVVSLSHRVVVAPAPAAQAVTIAPAPLPVVEPDVDPVVEPIAATPAPVADEPTTAPAALPAAVDPEPTEPAPPATERRRRTYRRRDMTAEETKDLRAEGDPA